MPEIKHADHAHHALISCFLLPFDVSTIISSVSSSDSLGVGQLRRALSGLWQLSGQSCSHSVRNLAKFLTWNPKISVSHSGSSLLKGWKVSHKNELIWLRQSSIMRSQSGGPQLWKVECRPRQSHALTLRITVWDALDNREAMLAADVSAQWSAACFLFSKNVPWPHQSALHRVHLLQRFANKAHDISPYYSSKAQDPPPCLSSGCLQAFFTGGLYLQIERWRT